MIFDFLNKSWGPTKSLGSVDDPDDNSAGPLTAKDMAKPSHEFYSLIEPLGQLLWVAREAHRALRWHAKEGGTATLQKFLTIWVGMLAKWTSMPGWRGRGGGQTKWCDRIKQPRLSIHDSLKHPRGLWQAPPPMEGRRRNGVAQGIRHDTDPKVTVHCQESPSKKAKEQLAAELASQQVAAAVEDGWRLVYVDGSSKPLWKWSKYRPGGVGIYSQEDTQSGKISISEPLPLNLQQTNNVAEL